MLGSAELLILGSLAGSALLLGIRLFRKGKRLRLVSAAAAILLGALALFFLACMNPGTFHFLLPYEFIGSWKTTDLDGDPCEVGVYDKATSNSIPPGVLDRLKIVARTRQGGDSITYQTHWRHGLSTVRAADGGIDAMTGLTCCQSGFRFLVQGGRWQESPELLTDVGTVELLEPMKPNLSEDLRSLVDLIHNSPRRAGGRFNPVLLIRAVNGLQAAGKERALRAIEAYRDLAARGGKTDRLFHDHSLNSCEHHRLDGGRVLPILGLLFENALSRDQSGVRLIDDVPFRFARGTSDVEPALKDCAERGRFLQRPLAPKGSPLEACEKLFGSKEGWDGDPAEIRRQTLYAVHNVYPFSFSRYGGDFNHRSWPTEEEWLRDAGSVRSLRPRWDSERQDFVRSRP